MILSRNSTTAQLRCSDQAADRCPDAMDSCCGAGYTLANSPQCEEYQYLGSGTPLVTLSQARPETIMEMPQALGTEEMGEIIVLGSSLERTEVLPLPRIMTLLAFHGRQIAYTRRVGGRNSNGDMVHQTVYLHCTSETTMKPSTWSSAFINVHEISISKNKVKSEGKYSCRNSGMAVATVPIFNTENCDIIGSLVRQRLCCDSESEPESVQNTISREGVF